MPYGNYQLATVIIQAVGAPLNHILYDHLKSKACLSICAQMAQHYYGSVDFGSIRSKMRMIYAVALIIVTLTP